MSPRVPATIPIEEYTPGDERQRYVQTIPASQMRENRRREADPTDAPAARKRRKTSTTQENDCTDAVAGPSTTAAPIQEVARAQHDSTENSATSIPASTAAHECEPRYGSCDRCREMKQKCEGEAPKSCP